MAIEFCSVDRNRKHRVHQWLNIETGEPMFGIQANTAYGKWAHVCVPAQGVVPGIRVPLLFGTRSDATAHIRALAAPPITE